MATKLIKTNEGIYIPDNMRGKTFKRLLIKDKKVTDKLQSNKRFIDSILTYDTYLRGQFSLYAKTYGSKKFSLFFEGWAASHNCKIQQDDINLIYNELCA